MDNASYIDQMKKDSFPVASNNLASVIASVHVKNLPATNESFSFIRYGIRCADITALATDLPGHHSLNSEYERNDHFLSITYLYFDELLNNFYKHI